MSSTFALQSQGCLAQPHGAAALRPAPAGREPDKPPSNATPQSRGSASGSACCWLGALSVASAAATARRSQERRRYRRGRLASAVQRRFVNAKGGKEEPSKAQDGFSFDQSLAARFLEIAEPYFVENGSQDQTVGFGVLLLGMMTGVAGATFFIFLAALAVASNVPQLTGLFPAPGAAATLAKYAITPYMAGAGVAMGVGGVIFAIRSEDLKKKWNQWGLLGLLIFLLFTVTGINVVISYVFRSIDNVLVAKDEAAFNQSLQLFVAVLVVAVPTIALYRYVRLTLARWWREFLTKFILERYFQDRKYYLLDSNSTSTSIDNPDQRISEDVDSFTAETLGFLLDILSSLSNLISFSAILWATSEDLTYALILYAIFGTVVALAVGGKLIGINYKQLQLQADFRYSLVHVRDNAEAIAFYQGETREKKGVENKLDAALLNFDDVIRWTTGLTIYQKIFFYVARLVPYFVVGSLYFAGKVDFGTLGQVTFAFSMVLNSVTLIVSRIQDISRFSAGVNRLGTFYEAMKENDTAAELAEGGHESIVTETTHDARSDGQIELDGITLWTPTGRMLVENVNLKTEQLAPTIDSSSVQLPSRLLVVGSSGVGKSSILRAIAGLWTQGRGRVLRPDINNMLFLPQKPYMPLGSLRTQLLYPADEGECTVSDEELVSVLSRFGLGDLPGRFSDGFDTTADWTRMLSLGEQQRLAAARCLLSTPTLAVLDEATSALPVKDERDLYLCLQERDIGYVSVGHRLSLVEYHDLILELLGEGKWRIMSPREYEASAKAKAEAMSAAAPN